MTESQQKGVAAAPAPAGRRGAWVLVFLLAGLVAVIGIVRAMGGREVVPWRDDLGAAQAEARRAGKPVFLYLTAAWCGPCQAMRRTTWADADVERALRDYVPVKVDIDRQPGLAQQYGVESIPHMTILDDVGRPTRTTGGAIPPGEFLDWLKR